MPVPADTVAGPLRRALRLLLDKYGATTDNSYPDTYLIHLAETFDVNQAHLVLDNEIDKDIPF